MDGHRPSVQNQEQSCSNVADEAPPENSSTPLGGLRLRDCTVLHACMKALYLDIPRWQPPKIALSQTEACRSPVHRAVPFYTQRCSPCTCPNPAQANGDLSEREEGYENVRAIIQYFLQEGGMETGLYKEQTCTTLTQAAMALASGVHRNWYRPHGSLKLDAFTTIPPPSIVIMTSVARAWGAIFFFCFY